MKVNILAEVLRKKKYISPFAERAPESKPNEDDKSLYYKDVAGFFIFLLAIFVFYLAAWFGKT